MPDELPAAVHDASAARRLSLDLVAALLVERALILRDVDGSRVGCERARQLLEDAGSRLPAAGPGHTHEPYLRLLRHGEHGYTPETDEQLRQRDLTLPLRLHEAALHLDVSELGGDDAIDEALRWEVASAASHQTMREWALSRLFVEFAA